MQTKSVLRRLNVSQREIARKLNVTPSSVSQYLSNPNTSVKMLRRIAEAAGCSVGDFFADEMTEPAYRPFHDYVPKCPHCGKPISVRLVANDTPTD